MTEAGATAQQKEAAMQQLAEQHEQIEKYAQTVEQELENKLKIEQKLKSLEKRVLHGGENMVEKMSELKKLAKATKAELEVQRWGIRSALYAQPGLHTAATKLPSVS